jgi:hypothetical protein
VLGFECFAGSFDSNSSWLPIAKAWAHPAGRGLAIRLGAPICLSLPEWVLAQWPFRLTSPSSSCATGLFDLRILGVTQSGRIGLQSDATGPDRQQRGVANCGGELQNEQFLSLGPRLSSHRQSVALGSSDKATSSATPDARFTQVRMPLMRL